MTTKENTRATSHGTLIRVRSTKRKIIRNCKRGSISIRERVCKTGRKTKTIQWDVHNWTVDTSTWDSIWFI